jgi:hypothetical protein
LNAQDAADAAEKSTLTLGEYWLRDQAVAFAATLLGTHDPLSEPRPLACAKYLADNLDAVSVKLLSDSTLRLLATIDKAWHDWYSEARVKALTKPWKTDGSFGGSIPLGALAARAEAELRKRDKVAASELNRILISHTVYLLRRPHLSALKILKWLHRAAPRAVPGIEKILQNLQHLDYATGSWVEAALNGSRDTTKQTRDRLADADDLYGALLVAVGPQLRVVEPWLVRILTAYRSSMFCWPLLTEGTELESHGAEDKAAEQQQEQRPVRGLSLPIALFVFDDGKSDFQPRRPNPNGQKIWLKYILSRTEEKSLKSKPKFQRAEGELPARLGDFRIGFFPEWLRSFQVGLDVAKKLWASQNGRLKFVDREAAERKLAASLYVDLRAACDIVEAVLSTVPVTGWQRLPTEKRFFMLGGRSAEAYWLQCALSLLLPSSDVPMGVCTGKIEYHDSEFEMGNVRGISAKLEYANRAGFPRVVIAGDRRDYFGEEPVDEDEKGAGAAASSTTSSIPNEVAADLEPQDDPDPVTAEMKAFLERLHDDRATKTLEVNFARTARAAADALQPSGWRRTDFLRTPAFQKKFLRTQRRLFVTKAYNDQYLKRNLTRTETEFYEKKGGQWHEQEEKKLRALDKSLTSQTGRTVIHVTRADLRCAYPGLDVETALGKWAAWKDHQTRSNHLEPGLGVATLRSADGDRETRLWAALAQMLDADDYWWEEFQWADLPKAADLLGQLLCNQNADPSIGLSAAPDLLIVFDDAGLATRRTNRIFPTEFHHQFLDLIHPRHPSNLKPFYLDAALKRHDRIGRQLKTRIVVVLAEDKELESAQVNTDLLIEDRALLERLSIFRFGSSRHAAYAVSSFDVEQAVPLGWANFEQSVQRLLDAGLLSESRSDLFLTQKGRQAAGTPAVFEDPWRLALAHRHAALALCPILYPQGARIASNRDRQLEPQSVLEAEWHLQTAKDLVPWRFRNLWSTSDGLPDVRDAQAQLTFLRTAPDWDTVKKLRENSDTLYESVDLSRELLRSQAEVLDREPPSTVVGLAIETLGRLHKNKPPGRAKIDEHAAEICAMVDAAIANLKHETEDSRLTRSEWQRRMRHLLSRQLYALRMLDLPLDDPRLSGARLYVDNAVAEILHPDFLRRIGEERDGLDDFPMSHGGLQALWDDGAKETSLNKTLSALERSRYAYAAARSNLPRTGSAEGKFWDDPWFAYFIRTRPEDVEPEQIVAPLMTWWQVYGQAPEASREFGKRFLDKDVHAARTKRGEWKEKWLAVLGQVAANLWDYIDHHDPSKRLIGKPVAPVLRLIRATAIPELLPAWRFMNVVGVEWLQRWPILADSEPGPHWPPPAYGRYQTVADEWSALAEAVIGHKAGWVSMLSSLRLLPNNSARLALVQSWLSCCRSLGISRLSGRDPEDLRLLHQELDISNDFAKHLYFAREYVARFLDVGPVGADLLEDPNDCGLLRDLVAEIVAITA